MKEVNSEALQGDQKIDEGKNLYELAYPAKYEIEIAQSPPDGFCSQRDYLRMIADAERNSPYVRKDKGRYKMVMMCLSGDVESLYMCLGIQILGGMIYCNHKQWSVERSFLPCRSVMLRTMIEDGEPILTVETQSSIQTSNILGISCSNPAEYINLGLILKLSGIPYFSAERIGSYKDPIIVVGGPGIGNPAPIQDMVDVFVYGMGEEPLELIVNSYEECVRYGYSREQFLRMLNSHPATLVPLIDSNKKVFSSTKSVSITPVASKPTTSLSIAIRDGSVDILVPPRNLVVLAGRGCSNSCGFCLYTQVYGRHVSIPKNNILDECRAMACYGFDRVYLLDSDIPHYLDSDGDFPELLRSLRDLGYTVDLTSIRADHLTDEMLAWIPGKGIAIAPEVASDYLRLHILLKTGPTNSQVSDFLNRLMRKHKFETLTFYCIIGVPTETETDIRALSLFAAEALRLSHEHGSPLRNIMFSVNPLFPTPHTPLEFAEMISFDDYRNRLRLLVSELDSYPEVEIYSVGEELFNYERVLQRGNARLASVLLNAVESLFKDMPEGNFYRNLYRYFIQALDNCGVSMDAFAGPYEVDNIFHWDHIHYPTRDRLQKSKQAIRSAIQSKSEVKPEHQQ